MDIITIILNMIFHLDSFLAQLIQQYGAFTYVFLFLIIFCETGLVFLPFFPGDSLLFLSGAFAAQGLLNIWVLFISLAAAAIIGDTVNYWIGKILGEKIFLEKKLVKKKHLDRAHAFFEKHGGKTIILARFVPIVRTVAPFVAGIGEMHYAKFLAYNVAGGIAWTGIFLFAGEFFGTLPAVQENLSLIIIAIIVISLLPAIFEFLKYKMAKPK
jgi:membrane-associated protein